jgi:hypothetical protein
VRIKVTGASDLYRFAHALNEAGKTGLKRELDRASRQAGEELVKEVEDSLNDYIPKNFERRWDQAFQAKTEVRLVASRRITVVFWAMGKRQRRDIKAINVGNLKHPIYGRYRRLKDGTLKANPWVSSPPQPIRPGLVDEPVRRATPRAIKKLDDAVKRVVDKIEKAG